MSRKILLIDDEIPVREFVREFLEDRDFNVESACDGLEGVEKFQKENFDLVICDMLMPKMIGVQVLRKIKELKPDQKVIMMTGVTEASMREKAEALGCHLYLTKPVKLTELEAKVNDCFPK